MLLAVTVGLPKYSFEKADPYMALLGVSKGEKAAEEAPAE